MAGSVGSVALTLYATQRVSAPGILVVLFTIWVVSPFVILTVGHVAAKRWSTSMRAIWSRLALVIATMSLPVYAVASVAQSRPKTAVFVMVAPVSWLLIAVVVGAAALRNRRH